MTAQLLLRLRSVLLLWVLFSAVGLASQATCAYDAHSTLAEETRLFPSGGDRLLGTLGPARLNHAEELAATIQRIEGAGGNIAWREGEFVFSSAAGQPGRVILEPNASIAAVRHEAGHFFDDLGFGHPGLGYYLQNPEVRWASEYSSYIREIRLARRVTDRQAACQLLQDA